MDEPKGPCKGGVRADICSRYSGLPMKNEPASDPLHATFEVGHGAGLLTPQRGGEEHVGALRRLGLEAVDDDDRVNRVERPPGEGRVGT